MKKFKDVEIMDFVYVPKIDSCPLDGNHIRYKKLFIPNWYLSQNHKRLDRRKEVNTPFPHRLGVREIAEKLSLYRD